MSEADWRRAKEIFGEAIDVPPEKRDAYLAAACAGDAALRGLVERLLASHLTAPEFMGDPSGYRADPVAPAESDPDGVGDRVGRYTIVSVLGEGGFGTVYEAEQSEPLRRRVALKVIKLGMDTRRVLARFDQERQALALMDHPSIATVYDAGVTSQGRPFFVMELIDGVPITRYCDEARLTPRQRLELFIPVCQAVQHAHQKGIIHRDLKPSNVLVMLQDDRPVPKIIDFGIAKAAAPHPEEQTVATEQGQLIGTPEYMSPEQAGLTGLDIDTRSDVYSLGVLLYELLAGATPFDAGELRSASLAEMQRIIREVDPPRPSTRVATLTGVQGIAACRGTEPGRLGAMLRGDLDWIVMKCLEKDRARRYHSAAGLAADVQRHLDGEAVLAAPPDTWYRATRVLRRHKAPVIAASLVLMALLLGVAGTAVGLLRARAAKMSESRASEVLSQLLEGVGPSVARGRDTEMLKALLDDAAARLQTAGLQDSPEAEVRLRGTIGRTYTEIAEIEAADRMLSTAVELAKKTWRRDHESVAGALNDLGELRAMELKFAEAATLFTESLAMRRRLFRRDRAEVAQSLNNLAYCLQGQGKPADALPFYRESLEMRRRLYTGDHADIAQSLNNVGYCLVAGMGDHAQGLPMYEASLEMRQRLFPGDHPDVAVSMSNVGAALLTVGKAADALPHFESALDMCRRLYSRDHPFPAQTLGNVAFCLQRLGATEDALPLYKASLEMYQRMHAGDNESVAAALNNLGFCLAELGQFEEALVQHRLALGMRRRLGLAQNLVFSLNNVGKVLLRLGHPVEAEPVLRECLEVSEKLWPDGDPRAAHRYTTTVVHGEALAGCGRFTHAEAALLRAWGKLATRTEQGGDGGRKAAQMLVDVYRKWDEAEPGQGHDAKAADWNAKLLELDAHFPPAK